MRLRFTLRQLEAFVATAELNGFRQAAIRLHLSPSAISNLVSELETAVGFPVFARTTRRVALTTEGRRFLSSAEAVLRQMRQATLTASDIGNTARETIRIAAPQVVAATLLPPIIASLHAACDVSVRIIDTPVMWLCDRVAIGEADLAIGPDREPPANIRRSSILDTPWVLWCRSDNPFAARDTVAWRELTEIDVNAAGRDHEERIWPRLRESDRDRLSRRIAVVDNVTTALGLAAGGLGVTFTPDYVRPLGKAFGLIPLPLAEPEVVSQLSLYEPAERQSGALSRACNHILEMAPTIAASITGGLARPRLQSHPETGR